jgi:hypothetical protein
MHIQDTHHTEIRYTLTPQSPLSFPLTLSLSLTSPSTAPLPSLHTPSLLSPFPIPSSPHHPVPVPSSPNRRGGSGQHAVRHQRVHPRVPQSGKYGPGPVRFAYVRLKSQCIRLLLFIFLSCGLFFFFFVVCVCGVVG